MMVLLGMFLGILGSVAFVAFLFARASVGYEHPERGFVRGKQPLEDQTDGFGEAAAGDHDPASSVREAHDHA
jgi:hypothetical protein